MHCLVFHIEGQHFALDTDRIHRIIPCIPPRRIPHAPPVVSGIIKYRNAPVPVIDTGILLDFGPSPLNLSTRILLTRYSLPGEKESGSLLGLIAPSVFEIRVVPDSDITPKGIDVRKAPFMGALASVEKGFLQLLRIDEILTPELREILFADTIAGG